MLAKTLIFGPDQRESKLWQKFRSINDQVFAKRDQVKSVQQAELVQLTENFNQELINIKVSIDKTDEGNAEKVSLNIAKEQAEKLLSQVFANRPILKSVVSSVEAFIKQLNVKIEQQSVEQENKSWKNLFSLLKNMAQDEFVISAEKINEEVEFQQLTSFWQKRLTEQCLITTKANADTRANKTLELEILAHTESPIELAAQRMAVQVSLMQEQMQSATKIDLSQSLVDWLRLGKLQTADFILLSRIEKIFTS